MALISENAQNARRLLTEQFAPLYPGVFRALQDVAVAGSQAIKNNGRRAWFGFGRDLSLESTRKYQDSLYVLAMACFREDFLNQPATRHIPPLEQIEKILHVFFMAYPNWPDAVAAWDVVGRTAMEKILSGMGC